MKATTDKTNVSMVCLSLIGVLLFAALFGVIVFETPTHTGNQNTDNIDTDYGWSSVPPEGYDRLAPPTVNGGSI